MYSLFLLNINILTHLHNVFVTTYVTVNVTHVIWLDFVKMGFNNVYKYNVALIKLYVILFNQAGKSRWEFLSSIFYK